MNEKYLNEIMIDTDSDDEESFWDIFYDIFCCFQEFLYLYLPGIRFIPGKSIFEYNLKFRHLFGFI